MFEFENDRTLTRDSGQRIMSVVGEIQRTPGRSKASKKELYKQTVGEGNRVTDGRSFSSIAPETAGIRTALFVGRTRKMSPIVKDTVMKSTRVRGQDPAGCVGRPCRSKDCRTGTSRDDQRGCKSNKEETPCIDLR
jgi:hypothetical protein